MTGNKNIIKVPSKSFPQIRIICNAINHSLKKFKYLKDMIKIVKYSTNDDFTKHLSSICDGRLIWEVMKPLKELENFSKRNIKRFIFLLIETLLCLNASNLARMSESSIKSLNFKNFIMILFSRSERMFFTTCNILVRKKNDKIKNKFWSIFYKEAKHKYDLDQSGVFYKHDRLFSDFITKNNIKASKKYGNLIYCVELNDKKIDPSEMISKWGYFYEINIKNIEDLSNYSNIFTQTLTYFGFNKRRL